MVWAGSCRGDFRVSVIGRQRDPHIALVGLEREPPPDRDHPLNLFGEDGADILRQRFIGSKKQFICKFSGIALEIALLGAPAVADAILVVGETTVLDLLRKRRRCDRGSFANRSEAHTSELQSLMRISYAVFCL